MYNNDKNIYNIIDLLYHIHFTCYHKIKHTTVKPILSSHSKIDKTKVLKTGSSLVQVESGAFCNTFDLH